MVDTAVIASSAATKQSLAHIVKGIATSAFGGLAMTLKLGGQPKLNGTNMECY